MCEISTSFIIIIYNSMVQIALEQSGKTTFNLIERNTTSFTFEFYFLIHNFGFLQDEEITQKLDIGLKKNDKLLSERHRDAKTQKKCPTRHYLKISACKR